MDITTRSTVFFPSFPTISDPANMVPDGASVVTVVAILDKSGMKLERGNDNSDNGSNGEYGEGPF